VLMLCAFGRSVPLAGCVQGRPVCNGYRASQTCTVCMQGYCLVYGYTCNNTVRITLSITVRFSFTTGVQIACRYLHWINSNRNIDPNLNLDPSVPVY